jgi:RNA polymerase sigma factor (sigma-70 family)
MDMGPPAQRQFEAFYKAEKDRCLRALTASTGDRMLAEDLIAEAFARAWSRWPHVQRQPNPAAYVMRVAYNLNVSWWRRHRRERPLGEAVEATHLDDVSSIDSAALLAALPERQRQVLALRVFLDLDTRETSDALGIAEGTVTTHLHRATTSLRKHLAADTLDRN